MHVTAQNFHDTVGGGMQKGFGLGLPVLQRDDAAGGHQRRQEIFHVPVPQFRQAGQATPPAADIADVNTLVIGRRARSPRPVGAVPAAPKSDGSEAIEIEMMRQQRTRRRQARATSCCMIAEREIRCVPGGKLAQRLGKLCCASVHCGDASEAGTAASSAVGKDSAPASVSQPPGLGLAVSVEREGMDDLSVLQQRQRRSRSALIRPSARVVKPSKALSQPIGAPSSAGRMGRVPRGPPLRVISLYALAQPHEVNAPQWPL